MARAHTPGPGRSGCERSFIGNVPLVPHELMDRTSLVLEVLGAAVIVCGILLAAAAGLRDGAPAERFSRVRRTMGRGILLGLEVLVAADIIRTVAVTPTLVSVVVLAVIVLIRTFLSFSLSVEIDGALPWRRAAQPAPGAPLAGSAGRHEARAARGSGHLPDDL